jgi:hypothetical protein
MGARVFVSHRPGDAASGIALARELDADFGDGQVVRIAADAASAERWREALAGRPGDTPVLVALVTAEPAAGASSAAAPSPGAAASDDAALRAQLDAALAAGILILPVLGDGIAGLGPDAALPAPFRRLSHLGRQPLREADWPGDIARLAETLRGLGVRPLASTLPGTMQMALPDEGPITTPMPADADLALPRSTASGGRRGALAVVGIALLLAGGWGAWRWRHPRLPEVAGVWRTRIGPRGASTSRDGALIIVTLTQKDRSIGLSSTVGIAGDPQWESVREAWKKRTGADLKQLNYRGEGELVDEDELTAQPLVGEAAAGVAPASSAELGRARRTDARNGTRWVRIAVQITVPGVGRESIDTGVLRGVLDRGDQSIQGRLWLESEQGERVVDLRRQD